MADPKSKGSRRRSAPRRAGRKPGQTSPQIARAAQENGELGGRKPYALAEAELEKLGQPPTDPLQKAGWWARVIELLAWQDLLGLPVATKLERMCKAASSARQLKDDQIEADALAALARDDDEIRQDQSPAVTPREVADRGIQSPQPLRRDPS